MEDSRGVRLCSYTRRPDRRVPDEPVLQVVDGHVRKLTVLAKDADRIAALGPLWTDPRFATLEKLVVRFKTTLARGVRRFGR